MTIGKALKNTLKWTAVAAGAGAAGYAVLAATAWHRYGRSSPANPSERDPLLDQFIPEYDVAERHHIRVNAPAATTLAAAADVDMQGSGIVRAIFRARELALGASANDVRRSRGLLDETTALGWRVIAEDPGHEVVLGAVTQPWLPEVVFRGLPPEEFRNFAEPGYVRIAWTLRADPDVGGGSIFRTETRVATTDATARARFRWYWARFSPGIVLIRHLLLRPLAAEAERRARSRSS